MGRVLRLPRCCIKTGFQELLVDGFTLHVGLETRQP